ncbi:MAG: GTPase HflX, partial [Planctomycetia bacterium]|nr:GTPase HflX [Planctomycetia bacterium]
SVVRERVVLVEVTLSDGKSDDGPLKELARLADTAGAEVVDTVVQKRRGIHPGLYVGSGKAEEIGRIAKALDAHAIIFDNDLSPAQIRSLEEITQVKVIDRSELILDIFATRARTREARLQVELAQLEYTYPRLVRRWSHLSRMEAGIGTRGPGETQLETDRRLVRRRITDLKGKLAQIDRRREREVQARANEFTVSLVGYTNAGKTSLLNAVTGAHEFVEDKLFATLDTRTRNWPLGHGTRALLSDTVGFIRNLPHHLVASFKATLEEAVHSDLLLHVVDSSAADAEEEVKAVESVLAEIGCAGKPSLIVLNKQDICEPFRLDFLLRKYPDSIAVCAKTAWGLPELQEVVLERLAGSLIWARVEAPHADGRLLAWLSEHVEVLRQEFKDETVVLDIRAPLAILEEAQRRFDALAVLERLTGGVEAPGP